MPSAIEVPREGETEGLWQKCCGLSDLSLEDFYAHVYHSLPRSYDPSQRIIADVLVSAAGSVNQGSRVLYVGHSNGNFSIELGRKSYKGDSVELSCAMVMKVRLKDDNVVLENVEFIGGDVERSIMLYPDNVFDCILSVDTLHALEKSETVIREYFRVLKPSGGIILAEQRRSNRLHNFLNLSEDRLRSKLEAAGFRMNSMASDKSVNLELMITAVKPRYYFEIGGYRFLDAESREDREKVWGLLHQVYCLELGVEAEDPSGFLRDVYDEYATQLLAVDENNQPVGAMRIVPENPEGFPMDSDFPLTEYMRTNGILRGIEGGRFVIHKDVARENRGIVAFGLFKCLFDYCSEMGINDVFTTTMLKIVKKYNMPGFKQIGEPFRYPEPLSKLVWVPMHCDIREAYKNYLNNLAEDSDMQGEVSTES